MTLVTSTCQGSVGGPVRRISQGSNYRSLKNERSVLSSSAYTVLRPTCIQAPLPSPNPQPEACDELVSSTELKQDISNLMLQSRFKKPPIHAEGQVSPLCQIP